MLSLILILAGTRRVAVTIARSLHRRSIPVDVAVMFSESGREIRSRAIRHLFLLPDWHENPQAFQKALEELICRYHYDVLIPTTDDSLNAICGLYTRRRLRPLT